MPYYHAKDGGKIHFWRRRCDICGKQWPLGALFSFSVPKGMTTFQPDIKVPEIKKGKTTYASWGDKVPGVGTLASWLPNWPRWARILVLVVLVMAILYGLWTCWGFIPE